MISDGVKLSEVYLKDVLVQLVNKGDKVNSRFIKTLLENGINIDLSSEKSNTASLILLAYLGLDDSMEFLINKGTDIHAKNAYGMNAFHCAVAGGNLSTVDYLMTYDIDLFAKAEFEVVEFEVGSLNEPRDLIFDEVCETKKVQISSFAFAFNNYNPKIIKLLLEKGFDPNENVLSENGFINLFDDEPIWNHHVENSAASIVCKKNDTELLRLMLEKGANRFDISDLAVACENLNFEMIKLLVECGVDIKKPNTKAWTRNMAKNPLSIVCSHSSVQPNGDCASKLNIHGDEVFKIISYLIEHGADVNLDSPLMAACSLGFDDLGFDDLDFYELNNKTGHENEFYGEINLDIIKLLLEKGADVNYVKSNGRSILHNSTVVFNAYEVYRLLLDNGANVNHKDNLGNTPLMSIYTYLNAINFGKDIDDIHIDDIHIEDIYENRNYNSIIIFKLLLEYGTDIYIRNNMGMTALMKYAHEGVIPFVKLLLRNGADVNAKSEMTAFDLTQNDEIRKLIKSTKNNYPQKLVKLLSNFTIDKPIKYTTHTWDFGELKNEYGNFDGYMDAVRGQFLSFENELKDLSANLYKKIYTFLLDSNPDSTYSWCTKTDLNIGWSSLDGLREHCDDGKNAFDYNFIFYGIRLGRLPKLTQQQVLKAIELKNNQTSKNVANRFGVGRSTLLRHIAKQKKAS